MLKSNPAKNLKKAERFQDTMQLYCATFSAWVSYKHPSLFEEFTLALANGEVAEVLRNARREYEENRSSK